MAEGEHALGIDLSLVQESAGNQLLKALGERVVVDARHEAKRRFGSLLSDYGGGLEQRLGGLEAIDSGGEDRLDGRRDTGVADRLGQSVSATLSHEVPRLHQLADDLL